MVWLFCVVIFWFVCKEFSPPQSLIGCFFFSLNDMSAGAWLREFCACIHLAQRLTITMSSLYEGERLKQTFKQFSLSLCSENCVSWNSWFLFLKNYTVLNSPDWVKLFSGNGRYCEVMGRLFLIRGKLEMSKRQWKFDILEIRSVETCNMAGLRMQVYTSPLNKRWGPYSYSAP